MTETNMEEYFNLLNSNKILIGILSEFKKIEIPIDFFSNVPDSEMIVTINQEESKFIFTLKENNEI